MCIDTCPVPEGKRTGADCLRCPETMKVLAGLPPLYATENADDPEAKVKFFAPDSNWTWYALEFDGKDTFFGLVNGFEKELGYFSLSELQNTRGPLGLPVERDLWFKPCPLSALY